MELLQLKTESKEWEIDWRGLMESKDPAITVGQLTKWLSVQRQRVHIPVKYTVAFGEVAAVWFKFSNGIIVTEDAKYFVEDKGVTIKTIEEIPKSFLDKWLQPWRKFPQALMLAERCDESAPGALIKKFPEKEEKETSSLTLPFAIVAGDIHVCFISGQAQVHSIHNWTKDYGNSQMRMQPGVAIIPARGRKEFTVKFGGNLLLASDGFEYTGL